METARGAPNEGAEIRFDADGRVALLVGTQSNGMGHETAYAQIAADLLGLPMETFRYVQADTAMVRAGNGHGGARSMHMGGAALCKAVDTMLAKGRVIAARLLQASPEQITFADGAFTSEAKLRARSICWPLRGRRAIRPTYRTERRPAWTPMFGTCWTRSRSPMAVMSPRWRSIRTPGSSRWTVTLP